MLKKRNNPNVLTTPYHYSAQWDGGKQAEFAAGRYCATKAIEALTGRTEVSVESNHDGSPQWPDGVVGSITHTDNFVSAAVAPAADFLSIGIDSEKIMAEKILDETKRVALLGDEHRFMLGLPFSAAQIVTLIFSAKESVYKCVHPLVKYPFDFSDVDIVDIDVKNREFDFRFLLSPMRRQGSSHLVCLDSRLRGNDGRGRFEFDKDCVHTGVAINFSSLRLARE